MPEFHFDPEDLEKYAMESVSAAQAARIEEHLLICETCRQSLQETEEFVTAMQSAARTLRRSARKSSPGVAGA